MTWELQTTSETSEQTTPKVSRKPRSDTYFSAIPQSPCHRDSPLLDTLCSPSVKEKRVLRAKDREIRELKEKLAEAGYCKEEAEEKLSKLKERNEQLFNS
jgi:hypothetical protein